MKDFPINQDCTYDYEAVLRSALWGEPRLEIIQRLHQAGYSAPQAEAIYLKANQEREQTIREHFRNKIKHDTLVFLGCLALWFLLFGDLLLQGGLVLYPRRSGDALLAVCAGCIVHGIWATYRMIFPQFTEGPVADLD